MFDSFAGAQKKPLGQQHHGHSRPGTSGPRRRVATLAEQIYAAAVTRNGLDSDVAMGCLSPERAVGRNLSVNSTMARCHRMQFRASHCSFK